MDVLGLVPSLFTLLLIIRNLEQANAAPEVEKSLIDLDISGTLPKRVRMIKSKKFPGGVHYAVKNSSRHSHIIGDVKDVDETIILGDERNMTRYVFVMVREDGCKYVRVINRYRSGGKYSCHLREFFRGAGVSFYKELFRNFVETNLMIQDSDNVIKVDIEPTADENTAGVTRHYSIEEKIVDHTTIGIVKYGEYTVDDKIEDLLFRKVIWKGGLEHPAIIVESVYRDGSEVRVKYKLSVNKARGFYVHNSKRGAVHMCD